MFKGNVLTIKVKFICLSVGHCRVEIYVIDGYLWSFTKNRDMVDLLHIIFK